MYLRTTSRRNADGSTVRYVQLAHNRRVEGVTQAQVLLNPGREDRLDPDGLRRLVASINRYLGEPGLLQQLWDPTPDVTFQVSCHADVTGSRFRVTLGV
jgi:hypothetical protein